MLLKCDGNIAQARSPPSYSNLFSGGSKLLRALFKVNSSGERMPLGKAHEMLVAEVARTGDLLYVGEQVRIKHLSRFAPQHIVSHARLSFT